MDIDTPPMPIHSEVAVYLQNLPDEILEKTIEYLPPKSVLNFSLANKRIYSVATPRLKVQQYAKKIDSITNLATFQQWLNEVSDFPSKSFDSLILSFLNETVCPHKYDEQHGLGNEVLEIYKTLFQTLGKRPHADELQGELIRWGTTADGASFFLPLVEFTFDAVKQLPVGHREQQWMALTELFVQMIDDKYVPWFRELMEKEFPRLSPEEQLYVTAGFAGSLFDSSDSVPAQYESMDWIKPLPLDLQVRLVTLFAQRLKNVPKNKRKDKYESLLQVSLALPKGQSDVLGYFLMEEAVISSFTVQQRIAELKRWETEIFPKLSMQERQEVVELGGLAVWRFSPHNALDVFKFFWEAAASLSNELSLSEEYKEELFSGITLGLLRGWEECDDENRRAMETSTIEALDYASERILSLSDSLQSRLRDAICNTKRYIKIETAHMPV